MEIDFKKIKNIGNVVVGTTAPQEQIYFENGTQPFLRAGDLGAIKKSMNFTEIKDFVNDFAVTEKGLIKAKSGSIVFPKSGASVLTNNCAILGIDTYLVNHLAAIEVDEEIVPKEWVYFYLNSIDFASLVDDPSYPSLQQSKIENLKIPFPKGVDLKTKSTEIKLKLENVEKMRQAALKQKDAVDALRQKQLDEILNTSISTDVKFKKLKQFDGIDFSAGKAVSSVGGYYTPTGIPYLQVNNIDNEKGYFEKKLSFINVDTHELLKKSEVIKNDILVNIVGPPIGKICFYPKDEVANINQAIVRIRCPKELDYRFLIYYLRSTKVYNYFLEVKVGVRQWNISSTNIGDIFLPIISIEEQQEIVKTIELKNIKKLKDNIESQLEAIEAMPAAILREVFNFNTTNN